MAAKLGGADAATVSPAVLAGLSKEELLEVVFDLQGALTMARAVADKKATERENQLAATIQSLRVQLSVLLEENTRLQNAMRRSSSTEFPVEGLTLGVPRTDSLFDVLTDAHTPGAKPTRHRLSEQIRRNRKLYIKVCEAKDLPKRSSGLSLISDKGESLGNYVQVAVDDQEIGRTKPVAKSVFSLWNEEFDVQLIANFRLINITVWSKGKSKGTGKDRPVAQTTIKYETLIKDGSKHEDWYPLFVPRKAKHSALFGAILAEIVLSCPDVAGAPQQLLLTVRVIGARNLVDRDDTATPTASTYVALHILPDDDLQTTLQTQPNTVDGVDPSYNETFSFKVSSTQLSEAKLHLSVWSTAAKGKEKDGDDFLGQVIIPLVEFNLALEGNAMPMGEAGHWFPLSDRFDGNGASARFMPIIRRSSSNKQAEPSPKMPRSQGNLAAVVRSSASMELSAPNEAVHDFVAIKQADEGVECEQCGWHVLQRAVKCKVCGVVVHENCKAILSTPCAKAGSLRLSYRFAEETLLPYGAYNDLMKLLSEDDDMIVLNMLGSLCEVDRLNEVAKCSLNVFQAQGTTVRFLKQLLTSEIYSTKEVTTLFRSNTIVTKCVDNWLHMIGLQYLQQVLSKPINEIFNEKKNCELDPSRYETSKRNTVDFTGNRKNLIQYMRKILDAIFSSVDDCPLQIREVLGHLQADVISRFPEDVDIRYSAVGGFIFLRFFGPAILGPKLFGLRPDFADSVVGRTLTLAAKVLQNLANLVDFGTKEPYMQDMNDFIREKRDMMMAYIDALVLNRQALARRAADLEKDIQRDLQTADGNGSDRNKTMRSKAQIEVIKERVVMRRKDLELIKQFMDMDGSKLAGNRALGAADYAKRFNVDLEMELARLHSHINRKRTELLAALEAAGTEQTVVASRRLRVVLDQLDILSGRLKETEEKTASVQAAARERAGATVFY